MRKFSAHRIYPVSSPPIAFGIIETDEAGTILNIRDTGGQPVEEAGLEFYPGIIIPGMVNAHCHLELSHLKGLIPQHTGLAGFVSGVLAQREADPEIILRAAREADKRMYLEGISAVGDISNNGITLPVKSGSRIQYHTFIELFGLDPFLSASRFDQALQLAASCEQSGLRYTLSPHAPYSLSADLWERLSHEKALTSRISIHYNESPEEQELLRHGSGALAEQFRKAGLDLLHLPAEAPFIDLLLQKYLPDSDYLLVHNTLTEPADLTVRGRGGTYPVLCPRSNLYIENRLPDLAGFHRSGSAVCLGTDSLASSPDLSVWEVLKSVLDYAPEIAFEKVLEWATLNGARALGMGQLLGSAEPGKRPGLVTISHFDWDRNRPAATSRPVRLI